MRSGSGLLSNKWLWILLFYGALVAASTSYRYFGPRPDFKTSKQTENVSIYDGVETRVAFKEQNPAEAVGDPLVLIHGSPGSLEAFDGLTKLLPNRHIIAVDLPGFGGSETKILDYSIVAHAEYVLALLKKKNIDKAHFLGFSLGGGVILHIEDKAPELVSSLTLVAAIGVQEYEMFGNYYINHSFHALQLGFFWILQEATPHFGLFDTMLVEYARNFYDTDQRPLRKILEETEKPFLIIHGLEDPLVPVAAAREHKRIVPQSEYHELDDNHFFVFMRPEKMSGVLEKFLSRVETGTAVVRKNADKERVFASQKPFEFQIQRAMGPVVLCFFIILFVVALFNESFAFLISAVWMSQGRFGLFLPLAAILLAYFLATLFWRRRNRERGGYVRALFDFTGAISLSASNKRTLTESLASLTIVPSLLGCYLVSSVLIAFGLTNYTIALIIASIVFLVGYKFLFPAIEREPTVY